MVSRSGYSIIEYQLTGSMRASGGALVAELATKAKAIYNALCHAAAGTNLCVHRHRDFAAASVAGAVVEA
jgi:hypothetical protein